jgi:hypothetical protein
MKFVMLWLGNDKSKRDFFQYADTHKTSSLILTAVWPCSACTDNQFSR